VGVLAFFAGLSFFSSLQVTELREALKAKGLSTAGIKAVLVARLVAGTPPL
jgi:hypothetical protein